MPSYINANGATFYDETGTLVGEKFPQANILDRYHSMYRYYIVEEIKLVFRPSRLQIVPDASGVQLSPVW